MTFKEWFKDMQERYQQYYGGYEDLLQEAFEAGAKQEREACALLASKCNKSNNNGTHLYIADAIRARGEA